MLRSECAAVPLCPTLAGGLSWVKGVQVDQEGPTRLKWHSVLVHSCLNEIRNVVQISWAQAVKPQRSRTRGCSKLDGLSLGACHVVRSAVVVLACKSADGTKTLCTTM